MPDPIQQPNFIDNPESSNPQENWGLAWDAAHAEKPYRELEQHAQALQIGHVALDMGKQADGAAQQVLDHFVITENGQIPKDNPTTSRGGETIDAETRFTHEQIKELIDTNLVTASWRPLGGFVGFDRQPHGERYDYNDRAARLRAGVIREATELPGLNLYRDEVYDTNEPNYRQRKINLDSKFREMDVPEVVTLDELRKVDIGSTSYFNRYEVPDYGTLIPGSPKAEERVFALSYATIRGEQRGEKFEHADQAGTRGGLFCYFRVILPESDAVKLFEQMKQDPALARQTMADVMQLNGGDESVDSFVENGDLPPYDKWRDDCGGVGRMAFRTAFGQLPKDSEVVEF